MRVIIDKVDFIKNFCLAKDIVKKMRRHTMDWEKIFVKDVSEK